MTSCEGSVDGICGRRQEDAQNGRRQQPQSQPLGAPALPHPTGYDCELVELPDTNFLQTECPVCLLVLREPHQVTCCGYSFCHVCIQRVQVENKLCPACNVSFTTFLNKDLKRKLYTLKVYCSNRELGCSWERELRQLEAHLNVQPSPEKLLEGCQWSEVECTYCLQPFRRSTLQTHQSSDCPQRPFSCDHCEQFKANFEEVTRMHWPVCPSFPLDCPNACGQVVQRREVELHVSKDCPLIIVACDFQTVGCTVHLPSRDMPSHISENLSTHMSLLLTNYLHISSDNTLIRSDLQRSCVQQKDAHYQLTDQLKQSHEQMRQWNNQLREMLQCSEESVKRLESEFDEIKKKLWQSQDELRCTEERITQLETKSQEETGRLKQSEDQLKQTQDQLRRAEGWITQLNTSAHKNNQTTTKRLAQLETDSREQTRKLQESNDHLRLTQDQLRHAEIEIAQLKTSAQENNLAAENRIVQLETKSQEQSEQLKQSHDQQKQTQDALRCVEGEIAQLKVSMQKQIGNIDKRVIESETNSLEQANMLMQSHEQLKQSHDQLKQSHDQLKQSHDQLKQTRDQISCAEGEIAQLKSSAQENNLAAEWRFAQLETKAKEESKTLKERQDQLKQTQDQLKCAEEEIAQMKTLAQENNLAAHQIFAQLETKFQAQTDQLSAHQKMLEKVTLTGTLPFDFTITQFQEKKENDVNWFSPPFYTHTHGYRMCIRVDSNGYGSGKGTHVSVFAFLMRGEFDDDLLWPFQGYITIQLLNQTGEGDHQTCTIGFIESTNPTSTNRVTSGERSSSGWGNPTFLPHNALSLSSDGKCQYLKGNQLKFRVPQATNLDHTAYIHRRFLKLESLSGAIEPQVCVAPITFTLTDFERHKIQDTFWHSPAFYTHYQGYKMCLRVYANGDMDGQGTHVTIYTCLMMGQQFDRQLKWPFRGDVTVTVLDQSGENHHEIVIAYNDEIPDKAACRPTVGERAEGCGFHLLLPHNSLDCSSVVRAQYLRFDTLQIRISKVKVNIQ